MKTIGLIGGMSYHSSLDYYQRINDKVNECVGGLNCAKIILYNVNFEEINDMVIDGNWRLIEIKLSKIAYALQNAGADYIAICSNTMHFAYDYIQEKINIPIIHIADSISEACKSSGIYNVGLIAASYSGQNNLDFMKERINRKNHIILEVPDDPQHHNQISRIIFQELCAGKVNQKSKNEIINIANAMMARYNIKGIVLGSTELDMLIQQDDLQIPIFDAKEAHINTIVDYILEKRLII